MARPPKFGTFHDVSNGNLCFAAYSKTGLVRIGGVKFAGLDRLSFDAIIHTNHHVN